jgi:hypothetical protein
MAAAMARVVNKMFFKNKKNYKWDYDAIKTPMQRTK